MKRLGKEFPNLEYEIYGKGGSAGLLKRIIELTGADWISLEGFEHATEVLPKAKVFLQTSISENMSLSVLESCASGVPAVVSDIRGHPNSCVTVSHESMDDIAEEVKRLLTDPDYWEAVRNRQLKEVEKYSVESIIPRYKVLFENLLSLESFKRESMMLEGE